MNNIQKLFKRQAQWQKKRAFLSWSEKIHWIEMVRETILQLRKKK